jgi:tetratricopeptide (TPR) repeat protein
MNVKRKSLWITLFVLATGGLRATAQDVQAALKALDADRFAAARTMFKQLAASGSSDNQFYLGYYYLRAGKPDSAKAVFDKCAASDPKSALCLVGQGGVALANKNLTEAKAKINQALEMTKNRDENVLWRAAEMYTLFEGQTGTNDPAEAIRLIDAIGALKKKTERADYQIVKGDAYLLRNEGGPAVSAYEEALRINTDNSNVAKIQTRIGRVFKRGKNYTETQKSFNAAIQADSNYAPVYREYGELWLMAGSYPRAATNYRKYLEKGEGTAEDKLRYAKFAFLSKDYQNAVAQLDQIKGKLKDTDINRMYGYSYVELNQPQPAVENLQQLIQTLPAEKQLSTDFGYLGRAYSMVEGDSATSARNDSLAYIYLGKAAPLDTANNYYQYIADTKYKAKDFKGAAAAYQQSVAWKDKKADQKPSANDYFRLGMSYYYAYGLAPKESRDSTLLPKADSAFAAVSQVAPTFEPAFKMRAYTNLFMDPTGTKGLAAPYFEKLIEVAQTDSVKYKSDIKDAYKRLAFYAQLNKNTDKATEYFTKVRNLDPADKDANEFFNPPAPPAPATKPKAPAKGKPAPATKPAPKKKG